MEPGNPLFPKSSLESRYRTTAAGGAAMAAGPADEPALDIGQPDIIGPVVGNPSLDPN